MEMSCASDDADHLVAVDQLAGDGGDGGRVCLGVVHDEFERPAEHAAGGVDVVDRHLAAIRHLRAERGVLAGDWADDGDRRGLALLATVTASGHRRGHGKGCDQPGNTLHRYLPLQG
jgi:hypothetical protein